MILFVVFPSQLLLSGCIHAFEYPRVSAAKIFKPDRASRFQFFEPEIILDFFQLLHSQARRKSGKEKLDQVQKSGQQKFADIQKQLNKYKNVQISGRSSREKEIQLEQNLRIGGAQIS